MGEGEEFVRAAEAAEIPPGGAVVRIVRGEEIAIFRADDGFFATDAYCPHRRGPLWEGELVGDRVVCPWHGWAFDLPSGECMTDAARSVRCYEVEVRDGAIWVGGRRPLAWEII